MSISIELLSNAKLFINPQCPLMLRLHLRAGRTMLLIERILIAALVHLINPLLTFLNRQRLLSGAIGELARPIAIALVSTRLSVRVAITAGAIMIGAVGRIGVVFTMLRAFLTVCMRAVTIALAGTITAFSSVTVGLAPIALTVRVTIAVCAVVVAIVVGISVILSLIAVTISIHTTSVGVTNVLVPVSRIMVSTVPTSISIGTTTGTITIPTASRVATILGRLATPIDISTPSVTICIHVSAIRSPRRTGITVTCVRPR
mgnify:CR=1 FL=1|jgi:hypothetical protein